MMRLLVFLFLMSAAVQLSAQKAQLNVIFSMDEGDSSYSVSICKEGDSFSIYRRSYFHNSRVILDSVEAGRYIIRLSNTEKDSLVAIKYVTLEPGKSVRVNLHIGHSDDVIEADSISVGGREWTQLELGYFNNKWFDNKSVITDCFRLGIGSHYLKAFGRQVGGWIGSGFGLGIYNISGDTTFLNVPQYKKIQERYLYFNCYLDGAFRFSTGNLKTDDVPTGFTGDIGARYCFPVLMNHVGVYQDSKKVLNKRIHQYTDLRVFANLGYNHLQFFFEYRLADFILGKYPELPRYQVGIKVLIPGDVIVN